jgi:hypothetical protein
MGKNVFVGPHKGGGWQAKKSGNSKASAVGETQAEMIKRGRELAKNESAELVIQGRNGAIRQKDSEGHDPRDRRG